MKFIFSYNRKIKARRPSFINLAQTLQWKFLEKDTERFSTFLKDISIFKKSRHPHKRVNNIVYIEQEAFLDNLYFFDYHFVVSSGNSTRIFDQSVFFAQSKFLALPEFELKPKSFFNKAADFFGKIRTDLNHPYLSENYLLHTSSPKVLAWINEKPIIDFLIKYPKISVIGINYQLVLFTFNKHAPLERLEETCLDYVSIYNFFKDKSLTD